MTLLIADCVSQSFGDRRVLTSATLRAESGQVHALLGRNGAGKSTLLGVAAGWTPADSGAVTFAGRTWITLSYAALSRAGLLLLPDYDLLSNAFTVRRQLGMLARRWNGASVEECAARMAIAHRLDQKPHQLSGGELRRAELAAVLVRRPLCLLADEPFRSVSPRDVEASIAAFREIAAAGCAVVITGHEVIFGSSRIWV